MADDSRWCELAIIVEGSFPLHKGRRREGGSRESRGGRETESAEGGRERE